MWLVSSLQSFIEIFTGNSNSRNIILEKSFIKLQIKICWDENTENQLFSKKSLRKIPWNNAHIQDELHADWHQKSYEIELEINGSSG